MLRKKEKRKREHQRGREGRKRMRDRKKISNFCIFSIPCALYANRFLFKSLYVRIFFSESALVVGVIVGTLLCPEKVFPFSQQIYPTK